MISLWLDDRPPIPGDQLDRDSYDVAVVGAGLTGLTTALLLAHAGRHVVVLEARHVGAVTTGNTTAKLSLLQGTKLSTIRRFHSRKVAQSYVDGNLEGQQWLLRFCESHDVPVQRRDAMTYAADPGAQVDRARAEFVAAREVGLPVRWEDRPDLPVPTAGGVVLPDQAQFDPMDVLEALAGEFRSAGGTLVLGRRVVGADKVGSPVLHLDDGRRVAARKVVLATGAPILDRGLYFAKLEPLRSYGFAFDHADAPQVMALSTESTAHSLRDAPGGAAGTRLLVGGAGHVVGRARSEADRLDRLREWTHRYFPGAVETHAWSAQDYASHDHVPYVGALPRGGGDYYVATGFDKWGMASAVMAALNLSAQLHGNTPSWAKPMAHRITGPRGVGRGLAMNAGVGAALAGGLAEAAAHPESRTAPAEGEGRIEREGAVPVATSTVDGRTCRVSGLCTHLGGVLEWNDAEKSWDCPLHGSRFAADGSVLEGPAVTPLDQRSRGEDRHE
ncbi:FAD-dependent oxidoreductase [Mobilicoccus massiliensis]|uniref:FAD-dependent oxidoreductase n=1 Tax=Mobilicoccus massiliensis TaxID=1522310 RepID=UPI00058BFBB6|nr:FAD-dependent oxidoreductase [Mobilicoccus massiliensis]